MTPRGVILGIDPGTTGMGYALIDTSADPPRLLDHGLIPTPTSGTPAERLAAIADRIDALIAEHRPLAMALERLYFNRNARTAMAVAEARGIALLCASRAGVEVAEYTPQEVKLSVTGTGSADKRQVMKMLPLVLHLERPIVQDNVADAAAIALTHLHRSRFAAAIARAT